MAATITKEDERTKAAPPRPQHGSRRRERPGGDAHRRASHHPAQQMGAPEKLGIGKALAPAALARGAACSRPARLLALPLARRIPQGAVPLAIPSGPSCGPGYGCLHGNPLPLRRDGHIHRIASVSDPDDRRLAANVLNLEDLVNLGGDLPPFKCRAALLSGALALQDHRDPAHARNSSQSCARGIEFELVEWADTLGPAPRDPAAQCPAEPPHPWCSGLSKPSRTYLPQAAGNALR